MKKRIEKLIRAAPSRRVDQRLESGPQRARSKRDLEELARQVSDEEIANVKEKWRKWQQEEKLSESWLAETRRYNERFKKG